MITSQKLNESFLRQLGNVRVLRRDEELALFHALALCVNRAYRLIGAEILAGAPVEVSGAYARAPILAERRWGKVQDFLLTYRGGRGVLVDELALDVSDIYAILIKYNLRLVISIIKKKYLNRGVGLVEMINEGSLGISKTVVKFDYMFECKFSTYVMHWIKQLLYKLINNAGRIVNLPMHVISSMKKVGLIYDKLSEGREITRMEERYLQRVYHIPKKAISMDVDLQDKDKDAPTMQESMEGLSSEDTERELGEDYRSSVIVRVFSKLSPLHERVLRMRSGLGRFPAMGLEAVARRLGVSLVDAIAIEDMAVSAATLELQKLDASRASL